uniref:hypothetical protein n=1 Tax=Paractinoplanes polyasparticus TaxID=2856853 RepID=UPI001C8416EC|nr:hypothetical protein [Actinoplanes polyasparticus]
MTVSTVVTVPMTAGGLGEHMEATVQVEPEGVWLSLGRPGGNEAGAPMTPAEALQLSRELAEAAHQAGAS